MKSLEQFLVRLDSGPWSAAFRAALGFCVPEVLRLLSGGRDQIWLSLVLFMGLLVALRVGPAILRMILPFSREAKDIWFQRARSQNCTTATNGRSFCGSGSACWSSPRPAGAFARANRP